MVYCPKFTITAHLLNIIEEISAYREKILALTIQVPWMPILQRDAKSRTTHSSTAIEGNPLTLDEVKALGEGRSVPMASKRAEQEIYNQLAGIGFIEKNQDKKKITQTDLFKLHKLIASQVMDQGEPGKYRTFGVRVGHYFPPSAKQVPKLMKEYLEWWNAQSREWPAVISSAILHYRFEEIHPFGDGNGRMGRTLALWELFRRDFDTHHLFSIDEVYWENRSRYYTQLDAVRKLGGDLSGWLEYTAEVIHLTLEKVLKRVESFAVSYKGKSLTLTPKQERILFLLSNNSGMTPSEIWKALGVTKQGAAKILKPLLDANLIERVGTRKSGKYIIALPTGVEPVFSA